MWARPATKIPSSKIQIPMNNEISMKTKTIHGLFPFFPFTSFDCISLEYEISSFRKRALLIFSHDIHHHNRHMHAVGGICRRHHLAPGADGLCHHIRDAGRWASPGAAAPDALPGIATADPFPDAVFP